MIYEEFLAELWSFWGRKPPVCAVQRFGIVLVGFENPVTQVSSKPQVPRAMVPSWHFGSLHEPSPAGMWWSLEVGHTVPWQALSWREPSPPELLVWVEQCSTGTVLGCRWVGLTPRSETMSRLNSLDWAEENNCCYEIILQLAL